MYSASCAHGCCCNTATQSNIDTDVHDTLWRVVRACGVRNITLSSYVDAIVREHLERYRTQIEALHAPADENSRTRCSS